MLITIYNNEAKDSFQTNFKSNLILPKNCELKLTNAFIALAHRITIADDATKRTYKITANDEDGVEHDIVIDAGIYSLSALASEIQSKAQAVADAQKLSLDVDVSYDSSKGYAQGALRFDIEAKSRFANFFEILKFGTGEYSTFTSTVDNVLVSANTSIIGTAQNGNNFLGVSSVLDTSGTPVQVDSWGYLLSQEAIVFHQWLQPSQSGSLHQPPSIPSSLNPYGAVSIQDNGKAENYWFGFTSGSTNFTNVSTNDFDQIKNLDECPIVVLCVKTSGGTGFPANTIIIYENANGAGLEEVGRFKNNFVHNDYVGITIENGSEVVYWRKAYNGSVWRRINIKNSALRFNPSIGDTLHFCYSVYGANASTSNADASMKNIYGSLADNTYEKLDDYGQYIKWNWNGNGTELGFTEASYEDSESGNVLANLFFNNEEEVKVDGDSETETYKTAPYINLMIENLPVNSYTDINTDTTENELDMSKCVASIPRYDQNGKFSIGYNLMYNPVEANIIKLHNEHEINISQLRFRLQQADGQIPKDLDQPMSFVFDFNGEK